MPVLKLDASLGKVGWPVLAVQVAVAGARLDYQGQTQGGTPMASISTHQDHELALAWRPFAPAAWGDVWLGLHWSESRRAIAGTGAVGGLTETARFLSPGVRWRSPVVPTSGWAPLRGLRAEFEVRRSVQQQVHVQYFGLFDDSQFATGRRTDNTLRLQAIAGGAWTWTVEWTRVHQAASGAAALYQSGVAIGTVRQPMTRQSDVTLVLARSF